MGEYSKNVDILAVLKIIISRWKVILIITLIVSLLSSVVNLFIIKPAYTVNAKIFIGKERNVNNLYDESEIRMYQGLTKTYSEIMKTRDLIDDAVKKNKLNISADEILENIEITPCEDTQIIEISYKNTDRIKAVNVIVSVLNQYCTRSSQIIPNGTVIVIEKPVLPEAPSEPKALYNIILITICGFASAVALVLLIEYFDDTLRYSDEIEKVCGLPLIGVIPYNKKIKAVN